MYHSCELGNDNDCFSLGSHIKDEVKTTFGNIGLKHYLRMGAERCGSKNGNGFRK